MPGSSRFLVLGVNTINASWDGSPTTLGWHESATMPQTANGSMIVAWRNLATLNNDGMLTLTSGGLAPQFLDAPNGALVPSVLVNNWKANNLNLTNTSANAATPISVQAYGPGVPGTTPATLQAGANPVSMAPGSTAAGQAPPNYAMLVMQANSGNLTILGLIGGPPTNGNNACLFGLNFPFPKPDNFTTVTKGNSISFPFYWTTGIFVANLSPSNAQPAQVSLVSL